MGEKEEEGELLVGCARVGHRTWKEREEVTRHAWQIRNKVSEFL